MTVTEFIRQCEATTGNGKIRLMPAQEAVYVEKLRMFSGEQLSAIYDKVLELTEHFPKIKNIWDAARDLGYLQTESDIFRPHRWEESECRLCKGEGRICVIWLSTFEIRHETRVEAEALSQILPYAESCDSVKYKLKPDEFRTIFRCACIAGDRDTIPKGWPKWNKNIPAVRYR